MIYASPSLGRSAFLPSILVPMQLGGANEDAFRDAAKQVDELRRTLEGTWRKALNDGHITERGYPRSLVRQSAEGVLAAIGEGFNALAEFQKVATTQDQDTIARSTSILNKRSRQFKTKFDQPIAGSQAPLVEAPGFFAWMSGSIGDIEGVYDAMAAQLGNRGFIVQVVVFMTKLGIVIKAILDALIKLVGAVLDVVADPGKVLGFLSTALKVTAGVGVAYFGYRAISKVGGGRPIMAMAGSRGRGLGQIDRQKLAATLLVGSTAGISGLMFSGLFDKAGDNPLDFIRRGGGAAFGGIFAAAVLAAAARM